MSLRRPSCLAIALLGIGLALGACCRPCRPPPARDAAVVPTPEDRVARQWMARAAAAEPAVTKTLREIAEREGAELAGLEHRLKGLAATVSKLRRNRAKDPDTRLEDVELYDALRYTLVVADEPSGHHDATIRRTLETLEALGHEVERVKNYWPRGDTYSGTNCVVSTPDGLPWEIQFHTVTSYATKDRTHDDYERMREDRTPNRERRRLFDKMARVWESVPIPEGILEPGSLHAREEILLLAAP